MNSVYVYFHRRGNVVCPERHRAVAFVFAEHIERFRCAMRTWSSAAARVAADDRRNRICARSAAGIFQTVNHGGTVRGDGKPAERTS